MLRIAAALVLAAIACSDPHRDAQNRSAPMPPNVVVPTPAGPAAAPPPNQVAIVDCSPIQTRCGGTDDYVLDCRGAGDLRLLRRTWASLIPSGQLRAVVRFRTIAPVPVTIKPSSCAGSSAPVTFTLRHELIDYRRVADAAEAERVRAAWAATP